MTEQLAVGDERRWVEPSRRDPHKVLRISDRMGVLIKYADRTTEWWPRGEYCDKTQSTEEDRS